MLQTDVMCKMYLYNNIAAPFDLRSAPEVNLDGHYTHASDVWAFGILAWELYTSFTTGQDRRPYYHLQDDEVSLEVNRHTVGFLQQ